MMIIIALDLTAHPAGKGRSIRGRQQFPPESQLTFPPPQIASIPKQPNPPPQQSSLKDSTPYIPPEPTDDETEIFRQGITSGIHFEEYDKIPINVRFLSLRNLIWLLIKTISNFNDLKVSGENCPAAINTFAEAALCPFLMQNVYKSGYNRPTPVQKTAIPVILAKRDLMACAQTGSGKTAAFLLPIVESLLARRPPLVIGQPQVVIITPTRELTIQVWRVYFLNPFFI